MGIRSRTIAITLLNHHHTLIFIMISDTLPNGEIIRKKFIFLTNLLYGFYGHRGRTAKQMLLHFSLLISAILHVVRSLQFSQRDRGLPQNDRFPQDIPFNGGPLPIKNRVLQQSIASSF